MMRRGQAMAAAVLLSCYGGPGSDGSETVQGVTDPSGIDSFTSSDSSVSGTSESASEGDSDPTQDTRDTSVFDVGAADSGDTVGSGDCDCGQDGWSYLWAANSAESTVSKLNTRTVDEDGRFPTHPEGNGNPSRTSVSVDAKAVVVQNRNKPSMVKIWARPELCDPMRNGVPGLQTSTGPDDALPFEEEDCIAWFFDYEDLDMTVQRPVQWTQGTLNEATCEHDHQKIWAVTGDQGSPGHCGYNGVYVHRHDGETGAIEDTKHISEEEFPCNGSRGAYGGAVDADGNFWFLGWISNKLARIDFATLDVEIWNFEGEGYGITVDSLGRPWLTEPLQRFNPDDGTFTMGDINYATGIAEDGQGRMWVSNGNDMIWVDRETLAVGGTIPMPDADLPAADMIRGIAVDVDGMVWGVRRTHTTAYKVDPDFPDDVERYDGFNEAYTYSDMTGGQIQNVTCNPEG